MKNLMFQKAIKSTLDDDYRKQCLNSLKFVTEIVIALNVIKSWDHLERHILKGITKQQPSPLQTNKNTPKSWKCVHFTLISIFQISYKYASLWTQGILSINTPICMNSMDSSYTTWKSNKAKWIVQSYM